MKIFCVFLVGMVCGTLSIIDIFQHYSTLPVHFQLCFELYLKECPTLRPNLDTIKRKYEFIICTIFSPIHNNHSDQGAVQAGITDLKICIDLFEHKVNAYHLLAGTISELCSDLICVRDLYSTILNDKEISLGKTSCVIFTDAMTKFELSGTPFSSLLFNLVREYDYICAQKPNPKNAFICHQILSDRMGHWLKMVAKVSLIWCGFNKGDSQYANCLLFISNAIMSHFYEHLQHVQKSVSSAQHIVLISQCPSLRELYSADKIIQEIKCCHRLGVGSFLRTCRNNGICPFTVNRWPSEFILLASERPDNMRIVKEIIARVSEKLAEMSMVETSAQFERSLASIPRVGIDKYDAFLQKFNSFIHVADTRLITFYNIPEFSKLFEFDGYSAVVNVTAKAYKTPNKPADDFLASQVSPLTFPIRLLLEDLSKSLNPNVFLFLMQNVHLLGIQLQNSFFYLHLCTIPCTHSLAQDISDISSMQASSLKIFEYMRSLLVCVCDSNVPKLEEFISFFNVEIQETFSLHSQLIVRKALHVFENYSEKEKTFTCI